MNIALPQPQTNREHITEPHRHWEARLDLGFKLRPHRTVLAGAAHLGPLRVQRPFYPEKDGCCHVYLLHPPGGMVIGDKLTVTANLESKTKALITTPSAGRVYSAKGSEHVQQQHIHMHVDEDAELEWLPQETIVYEGANGRLSTRIDMAENAKVFAWDIVRLGRRASGERFEQGSCVQSIELWQSDNPVFIERNQFLSGSELLDATWGLQSASTSGTLFATFKAPRDKVDEWVEVLNQLSEKEKYGETQKNKWGLTQKEGLFIARFMGDSVLLCRDGFQFLWQQARPFFSNKAAVAPRIWNT